MPLINETVYVFLFRCEGCQRPITVWLRSPGARSFEEAKATGLSLKCCMNECGWYGAKLGKDAIESWAVSCEYEKNRDGGVIPRARL